MTTDLQIIHSITFCHVTHATSGTCFSKCAKSWSKSDSNSDESTKPSPTLNTFFQSLQNRVFKTSLLSVRCHACLCYPGKVIMISDGRTDEQTNGRTHTTSDFDSHTDVKSASRKNTNHLFTKFWIWKKVVLSNGKPNFEIICKNANSITVFK